MITTVQCSICSQLNNMPRVVVTDFRLHHTCSLIIVWLHSLSGVIRSILCNPHAFSPAIITRNNTFPVHHSMATCTHKIRSKLNFMLKYQNSIFYCHSALSQFSHIIFIACFSLQHFTMRFIGSHARQTCSVQFCSRLSVVSSHVSDALMLSL